MGIIIKNVPVKAHHSIGFVAHYHGLLSQIYAIITTIFTGIKPKLTLQMFFKELNDSIRRNSLVPTLLVFGVYPHMTDIDAPTSTINQYSIAMCRAMEEVRISHVSRLVKDELNTQNGLSTSLIHNLSLNSPVLVFCEKNASQSGLWKGS